MITLSKLQKMPWLPWIIVGILVSVLGLYVRLYPLRKNVTSDASEKATVLVINRVRAMIAQKVMARYPDLAPDKRNALIQQKFNEVFKNDQAQFRKIIDQVDDQILTKSPREMPYLLESDSYYYLDLTENVLAKGDVSDSVRGSKFFNPLMLAPLGFWEVHTWHPYVAAWVYRTVRLLQPQAELMYAVAFTSPILSVLIVAAFLFAAWAIGCQWPTAFISSIFFSLAPIYLKRSTYGWFDNDPYNVLFPLLTLGFLFLAVKNLDKIRKVLVFGALSAATIIFYSRFWSGWPFLPIVLSIGIVAVLLTDTFLIKRSPIKRMIALPGMVIGGMLVGIFLMYGGQQFIEIFAQAYDGFLKLTKQHFNEWPDLFIIVGELKSASLSEIIELTGGPIMFFGALAGILIALKQTIQKRTRTAYPVIILAAFFAVTVVITLSAQRFAILCLIPTSLLFAYALQQLWQWGSLKLSNLRPVKYLLAAGLFSTTLIPIIFSLATIQILLNPIFNSAWERALLKLRDYSPKNSIVDTWWAPGHFVKGIARRAVNFDGATINGEQAYWLNRVYLSQSEREALGLLRMMNTSSNKAAEYLQSIGWQLSRAVPLLREITARDKNEARDYLKDLLTSEQTEKLLALTHGTPPPSYMLIYHENVDGNVLLAYLGKWNFEKVEKLNSNPQLLKQIPPRNSKDYIRFLWNLVGGPYRQSAPLNTISQSGTKFLFDQGIEIDTATMETTIHSAQYGQGIPESIFYLDGDEVKEKRLANANLSYSVLLLKPSKGAPRCVLMDHELANSLIMKLYYFDGKGLKYFKPFAKESDLTERTKVFIYQVLWPKNF
ncbi:MAG: hypothetical protein HQL18_02760 [Candidatus Omnitrophica bacterium]|nr:hypothetical protein [Candidatus Omnitrophota bacterium]